MEPIWRIELFGGLRVVRTDREITRFRTRKCALLLAALALAHDGEGRGRALSRDELADLLWPDDDPRVARDSLRNALALLRRVLEPEGVPHGAVLVADRAAIQLNAVAVDVATFAAALRAAACASGGSERARRLAAAVDLYRGDFLAGYVDAWVLGRREWLAERYYQALSSLCDVLMQEGDLHRAVDFARRGLDLDPLREEPHLALIRIFTALGQPVAARRQYQELARILREELDATPSEAVRAAMREIERPTARRGAVESGHRSLTAAATEEHRLATVLVAAIRGGGAAATAGGHDPFPDAVIDALLRYGGRVDAVQDGRIVARFGADRVREDDPERAIHAALAIRAAANQFGVHVGLTVESGLRAPGGEALDPAADLGESGTPGEIRVGPMAYELTRRAFQFVGSSPSVPGSPTLFRVVEAALPRPGKPYGIEGRLTPFVGRERERAQLEAALQDLGYGRGGIVCISGEAGVGKSRLVAELKGVVGSQSTAPFFLEGRALERSMATGYALFVDLLCDYFGWSSDQSETERAASLVACLERLVARDVLATDRVDEMGPLLGHLLSLRFGSDWDTRLMHARPEQMRHQTLHALRDLLVAQSRLQPLVLVLEDLHWADGLSLDLISLLLAELPSERLLLIAVRRPERGHRSEQLEAAAARTCPECLTEVRLRELTQEQSRSLVEALVGATRDRAPMRSWILETARGNPLYIEEMARFASQAAPATEAEGTVAVPATIQSLVQSRVDRLGPDLKSILAVAAVIGRVFRRRVLEAVIEREPTPALRELAEEALVYEERALPEPEYSFRHALVQQAIYEAIPEARRRALHQRVGATIEALHAENPAAVYEELAYHFDRSDDDAKAFEYLLKAGEKSRRAYLNDAAIGYFEGALARLGEMGSDGDRRFESQRLEVLIGLGLVHGLIGYLEAAERCFRQALVIGKAIGLSPRQLVSVYHPLGEVFWWQSRHRERVELAEEGLALLGDDTECREAVLMNDQIAWGCYDLGDRARALEFILRNRALLPALPYSEDLHAAYVHQASSAMRMERSRSTHEEWCERLERVATACGDWSAVADALVHRGDGLIQWYGDPSRGVSFARRAREQLSRLGASTGEAASMMWLSMGLLSLGQLEEAEAVSRDAAERLEAMGHRMYARRAWRTVAVAALCRGEWQQALAAAESDFRLDRELGRSGAYSSYLCGRVLLAEGRRENAAERCCQAASQVLAFPPETLPNGRREMNLPLALATIEDAVERPERLLDLHRRLRELPDVHGLARSIQWRLGAEATSRSPRVAELGHESFQTSDAEASGFEQSWRWEDPTGDCLLKISEGIEIRAANGSDLWCESLTAPRLLWTGRPGVTGEPGHRFVAQTRCVPSLPDRPGIGGLLLWQDPENFLRLDRGRAGPYEVWFHGSIAGNDVILGRGRLRVDGIYLRLEGSDDGASAFCSADGERWFTVGRAKCCLGVPLEIGLHAIGWIDRTVYQGAYPEGTAIRFEQFALSVSTGDADNAATEPPSLRSPGRCEG